MVIKQRCFSHAGTRAVLTLAAVSCGGAGAASSTSGDLMIHHAKGTFDVKVTAQENKTGDATLGHLLLEKQLQGDLAGTSVGQMLSAGTAVEGSAGYVAIERFTGTLQGRTGSFVLQHLGSMGHGKMQLAISVLADSGTQELQGITGTLRINIEGGKHFYEFDYSFDPP